MKKGFFLFLLTIVLTACSGDLNNTSNNTKPSIMVSSYPIQFIVENLVGDQIEVTTVLPPGTDAHTYEPTAKDMVEIAESDLFIYTGAMMEPYAATIAKSLEKEDVLLISLEHADAVFHQIDSTNLEEDSHEHHHSDDGHGHSHGDIDPHFWLDPTRMITASEHIKTELSHHFPQYANTISENYVLLKKELENLNEKFVEKIEATENKTIFVSHAAYGYWEENYGIKQLSIRGLSPTNEPSQKDLLRLMEQVKQLEIPYVILEKNQHDKIAKLLADELNIDVLYIHHLSALTEKELNAGLNYISIMEQNLETLQQALGR